jgi:prevent-host-death family protein
MDTEPIIGAFEAKTRLSELLREAERGGAFVIERRGRKVARLVPYEEAAPAKTGGAIGELLDALGEVRAGAKGGAVDVVALIAEGRR